MGISYGMQSIAEFRVISVNGSREAGFSRLQFCTEIDIQATPGQQVLITSPVCFAFVGPSTDALKAMGRASIETSWYLQTADHNRRDGLSVYVDLTGEQLEAVERMREGRSLIFRLDMHVIAQSASRGLQRSLQQIMYEANVSTWAKVLKELGYMDVLLLAVELPLHDIPEKLKSSVLELRKAHADLIAGRYDAVVSRARLVMDMIDAVLGAEQTRGPLIQAFSTRDTREDMPKRQRADLVRAALRHYTHLAHHTDTQGAMETFSRNDAMFILAGTAAALWDATRQVLDTSI